MLKFLRNIFFLTLAFFVIVATPIYAILKSIAPEAIIESVESNLADGMSLTVGKVSSKANLEITYTDVQISSDNFSLIIPYLTFKPVMSFKEPVLLTMNEIMFSNDRLSLNAKNIDARLRVNGLQIEQLSIEGKFEEIGSLEDALISQGKFVIAGINSPSKALEIDAQSIKIAVKLPTAFLNVEILNSQNSVAFDNNLEVETVAEVTSIFVSRKDGQGYGEEYRGKSTHLNFSLSQEEGKANWVLPLNLVSNDVSANNLNLFNKLNLQAKGRWRSSSISSCKLFQILTGDEECGKLTDVLDVDLTLSNDSDALSLTGDGYCVAPRSGCRQMIKSRVRSLDTEKVFSRFLLSEAFNPVVTSILMGVLLGSPSAASDFTHSVDLDVTGSQVLINKKPLF